MALDPITFEVIRGAFLTAAAQIKASVMHTAYSSLVAIGGDLSCGVCDGEGRLVAQGQDIPAQLGALPLSIRACLEAIPGDTLGPGDLIVSNDPYVAGSNHLNDLVALMPVFFDGEIVAFTSARAHWIDIGGPSPGGFDVHVRDIYSEGLRVPPVRVYRGYEAQEEVTALLLLNVRNQDERRWDLEAQFAGCRAGEAAIQRLCEKYGVSTVRDAMAAMLDYSERRLRKSIADMPDGIFRFDDWIEGDGFDDRPVKLSAAVTIDGDSILVDFAGTDPQVRGGMNAAWAVTEGITNYVIKGVTDYTIPSNQGCERPVTITAPIGTVLNPEAPAPCSSGGTAETASRLAELLIGCFAQAVPDRVMAGTSGTTGVTLFSGPDPSPERRRLLGRDRLLQLEPHRGGLGARPQQDGINGIAVHIGNARTSPVEMMEYWAPLRIRRWEIVVDTGGAGRHRGGCGVRREYEILGDDWMFTLLAERARVPAFGLAGGGAGALARYTTTEPDQLPVALPSKQKITPLPRGSLVTMQIAGGGGYGPPCDRVPDAVAADVRNGYVSLEAARDLYGVVLNDVGEVDVGATEQARRLLSIDAEQLDRGTIRYAELGDQFRHRWIADEAKPEEFAALADSSQATPDAASIGAIADRG